MSAERAAEPTEAEVIEDPQGALLAIRRANIAQWHAEARAEQFEHVFSAFDALRRGDWAPSEYSPQWRARAEAAESKLAALTCEPSEAQIDAAMATLDSRGLGGRNGMRTALKAALAAGHGADAPRSAAHVVRTCPACGHNPHGVGIICWHGSCACRGNGGGQL